MLLISQNALHIIHITTIFTARLISVSEVITVEIDHFLSPPFKSSDTMNFPSLFAIACNKNLSRLVFSVADYQAV